MATNITFRGCFIRSFELKNGEDGRHVRINVTADWSKPVIEAMGWDEEPQGYAKSGLIGKLNANSIIVTPSSKEFKDQEIELSAESVDGFMVVPIKDSDGEVTGRELRFVIRTSAAEACQWLEQYCNAMGRSRAQMKISYEKQAELAIKEDKQIALKEG